MQQLHFFSSNIGLSLVTRRGHTSVRGIGFQCPLCVVRPGSSSIPADAEPRLAAAGPSAYGAGRSERCIAADVGDSVLDGAAPERPATVKALVASMWWAERRRDSSRLTRAD
ncbi:hypothetical protein, conserved, partial [Leishmania lindenbergi]